MGRISYRNRFLYSSIIILALLFGIYSFEEYTIYLLGGTAFMALFILITSIRLRRDLNRLKERAERIADGDYTLVHDRSATTSNNELADIQIAYDKTLKEVRNVLKTMQSTSDRIAGISEMLAAGTEQASSSIQEVSSTVNTISSSATEQNRLVDLISDELKKHRTIVLESARTISEASNFVLKVAQRTNILGLNASIESAKAGKYGKGFNVVANEVRELSDDTKKSVTQIRETIDDVNYEMRRTLEEVQELVKIIRSVAENTAEGGSQANSATKEQVIMIGEISQSTSELSQLAAKMNRTMRSYTF